MSGVDFRPLLWAGIALGVVVGVALGVAGFLLGAWLT
jgi:hypothetical protein